MKANEDLMNTILCQNLQRRLLELNAGEFTAKDRQHLSTCPECRAFAQDVRDSAPCLAAMAGQINRQSTPPLPATLKSRVLADIKSKLASEEPGTATARKNTVLNKIISTPAAPQYTWTWRDRLSELMVYLRWAAVSCVLLAVFTAIALHAWQGRTIGRLEFASGPTAVHMNDPVALKHQGLGEWACRLGSTLETDAKAGAIFSIGSEVRAAMAESTSLQILEKERIALKSGSVWLSVNKGGRGFKVETPYGLVQVTGTHFGVTVTAREARVEVTEGRVNVSQARQLGKVTAGQTLTASPGGITAAVARQAGTTLPGWVNTLFDTEKLAFAGSYLPSLGKGKP